MKTLSIPHHDLISWSHAGAPWVAYEWLSDLLMAIVNKAAGLNGLIVMVGSIIALLFLLLYQRCRSFGCHFVVSTKLVVLGALAMQAHWLARPHIFTCLGVYLYSCLLESFHRGQLSARRLVIGLGLGILVWVNLHPAFVLGPVLIAIYLACEILLSLVFSSEPEHQATVKRAGVLGAALAVVLALSLVNPYGLGLYRYIFHFLSQRTLMANSNEFLPTMFDGSVQSIALELLIAALITGLMISRKRPSLPQFVTCLAFGHQALTGFKHMPVFVVIAIPVVAELIANSGLFVEHENLSSLAERVVGWWQQLGQMVDTVERRCRMHLLPVIAVLALSMIALNGGTLLGKRILNAGFDQKVLPSLTLNYIQEHRLPPKQGFNYDNWGGYICYMLGIPVFIDDRGDFYGQEFYLKYARVVSLSPGWSNILDDYHIQWVLFPQQSLLVSRLKDSPDWQMVCQDQAACLLVRRTKDLPAK